MLLRRAIRQDFPLFFDRIVRYQNSVGEKRIVDQRWRIPVSELRMLWSRSGVFYFCVDSHLQELLEQGFEVAVERSILQQVAPPIAQFHDCTYLYRYIIYILYL